MRKTGRGAPPNWPCSAASDVRWQAACLLRFLRHFRYRLSIGRSGLRSLLLPAYLSREKLTGCFYLVPTVNLGCAGQDDGSVDPTSFLLAFIGATGINDHLQDCVKLAWRNVPADFFEIDFVSEDHVHRR